MNTRVTNGRLRMSAGAAVLALALAGCGGEDGGTGQDAKPSAASASPSAERALALADDAAGTEAGQEIVIDALANDLVKLENGTDAEFLETYEPAEFTLTAQSPAPHGTVTVEGTTLVYTPTDRYAGEDEFTYEVTVKGKGKAKGPAEDSAVVRITVSEPTPSPTPTPTPKPTPTVAPKPKAKATKPAEPSVYYENCDAARAAGATPVRRGDPGYAAHLDRDDDGVGCEPYGSSGGSTGGSSNGGSTSGGSGGGSDVSYANCTAVRAAGAAPIHRGDPGYGSHLDRDGDGVACE